MIRRISDGKVSILKSYTVGVVDERMELSSSFDGENQIYLGEKRLTFDILTDFIRSEFKIAEEDLKLRGPGDFFASTTDETLRQSGGFDFKLAK